MSQCTTTQDVLVKLEQAVERGDVPYLLTRTVNGTGHTGPSEFCATSI